MKEKLLKKEDLMNFFREIDEKLPSDIQKLKVRILGGSSIILLGIRDRATCDIDVAVSRDSQVFQKICKKLGTQVDMVTVASTVDLTNCESVEIFEGKKLIIESVTPRDLIKLKLERFWKQDPEDIYAIIKHEALPYEEFESLVAEAKSDYIGRERELLLSAKIVVEKMYQEHIDDFEKTFSI